MTEPNCIRVHLRLDCAECGYPANEPCFIGHDNIPHGTPSCRINCNGGCPLCAWDDHTKACVASCALGAKDCICDLVPE